MASGILQAISKFVIVNDSAPNTESAVTASLTTPEDIETEETQLYIHYKIIACIFGTIIFLSNLTVVISSGLIIKKGQQPKSTYLLLGNVSLADTIIGVSIIFTNMFDSTFSSHPICKIQMGVLVCPTMVSIFSVGLIAIDRYIYILHGLYYQRWFNTTRVRIGIAFTWLIGLILGFLPITGWVNTELVNLRCYYFTLFPSGIVLLNSLLSIVPIVVVGVLYSIILIRALRNLKDIKESNKSVRHNAKVKPTRIYRSNLKKTQSVKNPTMKRLSIQRSSSLHGDLVKKQASIANRSQSVEDFTNKKTNVTIKFLDENKKTEQNPDSYGSNFSIHTINSTAAEQNDTIRKKSFKHVISKLKEPNKYRGLVIVMLTSGCIIVTWMPFFVTAILFVFCEDKLTNPRCIRLQMLLGGPIAVLAFLNSILNPLIYAWWHKGFNGTIRLYATRCLNTFLHKTVKR